MFEVAAKIFLLNQIAIEASFRAKLWISLGEIDSRDFDGFDSSTRPRFFEFLIVLLRAERVGPVGKSHRVAGLYPDFSLACETADEAFPREEQAF